MAGTEVRQEAAAIVHRRATEHYALAGHCRLQILHVARLLVRRAADNKDDLQTIR